MPSNSPARVHFPPPPPPVICCFTSSSSPVCPSAKRMIYAPPSPQTDGRGLLFVSIGRRPFCDGWIATNPAFCSLLLSLCTRRAGQTRIELWCWPPAKVGMRSRAWQTEWFGRRWFQQLIFESCEFKSMPQHPSRSQCHKVLGGPA